MTGAAYPASGLASGPASDATSSATSSAAFDPTFNSTPRAGPPPLSHAKPRPLIEVENLEVRFGRHTEPVVKGISFVVNRGECVAIVGESGSGKSVTSRTLVGLTGQDAIVKADCLRFDGADVLGFDRRAWQGLRGARVGFVMQDALGSLDPLRTVSAEIGEALRLHTKLSRAQREAKAIELLASVGVPEAAMRARQYPHQLSGGLRQRALIASAIACGPELLIADELTTALDAAVQAQILTLLESLRTDHTGMLLVSHDFGVVARLADRIVVMRHGVVVEQGTTQAILHEPQHPYTRSLLTAVSTVHSRRRVRSDSRVVSREGEGKGNGEGDGDGKVFPLEASGLVKTFVGPDAKRRTVVSDVSFALRKGETIGIVGGSGSGKTTTMRLMLGLEQPDDGVVRWRGRAWESFDAKGRSNERKRVQIVFQDPLRSFDQRYTVERVIGEALGIAGYPPGATRRARSIELLELVALDERYLSRRPLDLSGGQRQRVAIARALAPEPEVLICDEPVSALDVVVQAQILDLLDDLKKRLGLSCLFISHDLGVIHHVSDRVLVMKDGAVVEQGDVREVFDRPRHPYTRALLDAIPHFQFNASRSSVHV